MERSRLILTLAMTGLLFGLCSSPSNAQTLTSISPSSGLTGSTVPVTLTGTNFVSPASVFVGAIGVSVSNVNVVSSTEITALFTIAANAEIGPNNVAVLTPGVSTTPVIFTVNPSIPTITSISPDSGIVGSTIQVILTGTNFSPGASVSVNDPGIAVSNVNVMSATQISATIQISPNAIIGPNWGLSVTILFVNSFASSAPVTFAVNPLPVINLSTPSLAFTYIQGNAAPPSQSFGVLSNGAVVSYAVSAVSSTGGSWLSVTPSTGETAGNVTVSLQNLASLSPGKYQGTVTVQPQNSSSGAQTLSVSLQVNGSQPLVSLSTTDLRYAVNAGSPSVSGFIQVFNSGGGALNYSVSSSSGSGQPSWLTVTCGAQGSATFSAPGLICVQLNPAGLPASTYSDSLTVTAAGQQTSFNVTLQVSSAVTSILLSSTGMTFTAIGAATVTVPALQTIAVLNEGQGTMNWTAQVSSNASWLTVSPTSGSSQAFGASQPAITFTANPSGMAAGNYYALVNVTVADGSAANSPAAVAVLMKVLPFYTQSPYGVSASGLIFTAPAGSGAPAAQQLNLTEAEENSVLYSFTAATDDGQGWLSATSPTDYSPVGGSSPLSVQVNPAGLAPGIYYGQVRLSYSNATEDNVDVTFFVTQPSNTQAAVRSASDGKPRTSGSCSQYGLAFGQQVPTDGGAVIAGQQYTLQVKSLCVPTLPSELNLEIDFSDGTGPLYPVFDSGTGDYEVTWTPTQAGSARFYARSNPSQALTLPVGTTQTLPFSVTVAGSDPTGGAILGGVRNSASYADPNEVAAGSFISIFGDQFASTPISASSVPFPKQLGGIEATLAGIDLPIYYAGTGQVNAIVPFLPSQLMDSPQSLVVYRNGAPVTLTLNLVVYQPGIFSTAANGQGQGAIQNASYQLVSTAHPARPGDTIVIYCGGLGPVTSPPAAGAVASIGSKTTTVPSVYIDGKQAHVAYSGLSPGSVQLYQVNAIVPQGIHSGAVDVYLTITDPRSNAILQSNTVTIN